MKRVILLAVVLLCGVVLVQGQTWTPVWKMDVPPYLTKTDITDMAMVKAGFDNFDEVKKLQPAFAALDTKDMSKSVNSAPLHEGAARYYKEKGWIK